MDDYKYNGGYGTHMIRTDFQSGKYKGYVVHKIGGNARGYSVIEGVDDTIAWVNKFKENTCNLKFGEDDWFNMILVDNKGDELIIEDEIGYLSNYIVGVKIIDYKKEEQK